MNQQQEMKRSITLSAMLFLILASFVLTAADCENGSSVNQSSTFGGSTTSSSSSGTSGTSGSTTGSTDPTLGYGSTSGAHGSAGTSGSQTTTSGPTSTSTSGGTLDESGMCTTDAQCGNSKDCVEGTCVNTGPLRFTLVWHHATDIDIHVLTPSGAKLWYRDRESADGGIFDSDSCIGTSCSNADGPLLENVYWSRQPGQGTYQFWVVNYSGTQSVPFSFDVKVNGERRTFRGTVAAGRNAESQRFSIQIGQASPPPTNYVTVEDAMRTSCTTTSVRGLSQQLIDELNCMHPGTMKSFAGARGIQIRSAVFPYLQTAATDAMTRTTSAGGTMTVSSALRTIPQQYQLYRWSQTGRCGIGLAARPGASNHNGGRAFDTPDHGAWRSRLTNNNYRWFGSRDAVHFDYGGNLRDVRSSSVLAFQRLWNRNNPNDRIPESGRYDAVTEQRLKNSPAAGFPTGASCGSPNALIEWFHPTVEWNVNAQGQIDIRTIAPADIAAVEYLLDGQVVHVATREDGANFDATLSMTKAPVVNITIRGYDHDGRIASSQTGWILDREDLIFSIRPNGPEIYEFSLDYGSKDIEEIAVIFNDEPVVDDRRSIERADDMAVFSHVAMDLTAKPSERALNLGLFNKDAKLVEMIALELP